MPPPRRSSASAAAAANNVVVDMDDDDLDDAANAAQLLSRDPGAAARATAQYVSELGARLEVGGVMYRHNATQRNVM